MFWRLRRSRSRKNTAGGKCRRGLEAQRTMRSVVVVIESPTINHPTGLLQAQEQFSVQQLVAQIGRRLDDAMRVLWPEPLATEIINIFRHTLDTGESYRSPGLVSPRADLESKIFWAYKSCHPN